MGMNIRPQQDACGSSAACLDRRSVLGRAGAAARVATQGSRGPACFPPQGGKSAGQRRAVGAQPDGPIAPGEQPPQARMMGGYRPGEEMALIKEAKALAVPAASGGAAARVAGR